MGLSVVHRDEPLTIMISDCLRNLKDHPCSTSNSELGPMAPAAAARENEYVRLTVARSAFKTGSISLSNLANSI
jgi:hypothetical protein